MHTQVLAKQQRSQRVVEKNQRVVQAKVSRHKRRMQTRLRHIRRQAKAEESSIVQKRIVFERQWEREAIKRAKQKESETRAHSAKLRMLHLALESAGTAGVAGTTTEAHKTNTGKRTQISGSGCPALKAQVSTATPVSPSSIRKRMQFYDDMVRARNRLLWALEHKNNNSMSNGSFAVTSTCDDRNFLTDNRTVGQANPSWPVVAENKYTNTNKPVPPASRRPTSARTQPRPQVGRRHVVRTKSTTVRPSQQQVNSNTCDIASRGNLLENSAALWVMQAVAYASTRAAKDDGVGKQGVEQSLKALNVPDIPSVRELQAMNHVARGPSNVTARQIQKYQHVFSTGKRAKHVSHRVGAAVAAHMERKAMALESLKKFKLANPFSLVTDEEFVTKVTAELGRKQEESLYLQVIGRHNNTKTFSSKHSLSISTGSGRKAKTNSGTQQGSKSDAKGAANATTSRRADARLRALSQEIRMSVEADTSLLAERARMKESHVTKARNQLLGDLSERSSRCKARTARSPRSSVAAELPLEVLRVASKAPSTKSYDQW
jgi:hypothetical protein